MQEIIELKASVGELSKAVSGSLTNLETEQRVLADRLLQVEQRGAVMPMDTREFRLQSLSAKLCKSEEAKQLIERFGHRLNEQEKAVLDLVVAMKRKNDPAFGYL